MRKRRSKNGFLKSSLVFWFGTNRASRRETNDDRDIPINTLRDPLLNVICPVKLLLIYALRSRNIILLDNALTQASRRKDQIIQWLFPERPVISQLIKGSAFIAWDKPARVKQVNSITKDLGLMAGILANIICYNVRWGAFRDLANSKLFSKNPVSVATREVARVTGHSMTSYSNGTTDNYVGEVEQDTYTTRAKQMFESRKAPAIGNKYKKRRLIEGEVTTYCKENGIDSTSRSGRSRAAWAIHRKRKSDWIESEKAKEAPPTIPSIKPVLT